MPWDGTRLMLGQVTRSRSGLPQLRSTEQVAGDFDTAVAQPCFSADGGSLLYTSDQRGYSQLWCRDLASGATRCLNEDTYDVAGPAWVQGRRAFSLAADSRTLYFVRRRKQPARRIPPRPPQRCPRQSASSRELHPRRAAHRRPARQGPRLYCLGERSTGPHRRRHGRTNAGKGARGYGIANRGRPFPATARFLASRRRHPHLRPLLPSGQQPLLRAGAAPVDRGRPRRPHRPSRDQL